MWLVWDLTGSPFYTGLAGALVQVPNALRFLIGPLVDRWRLRPILLVTQVINGIGVLVVPLAAVMGHLSVGLLLVLMPILAFVNGFVYPAQSAAIPQIVRKDELTRANSLLSTSYQTVDTVANAVAGALIAIIGAVALFVINSITFAIAAVLFLGVTVPQTNRDNAADEEIEDSESVTETDDGYVAELREGIDYVRGSAVLAMLLGGMVVNFLFMAANAVLPAFADSLGGPAAYGLLLAAMGAGRLVGTGTAFLVEERSLSWVAIVGFPLSGLSWLIAVAVSGVWTTAALMFVTTIIIGTFNVLFFSLLQSAVDTALLGRVTALMDTLAGAMMPVGALLGGVVAGIVGSATVMYGAGVGFAGLSLYFLVHPELRSLPSVSEADEVTLGLRSAIDPAESGGDTGSHDLND
jgi:MFS family permease